MNVKRLFFGIATFIPGVSRVCDKQGPDDEHAFIVAGK